MKAYCKESILFVLMGVSSFAPFTSRGNTTGQTRTYYIAADEVRWDYALTSMNEITGGKLSGRQRSASNRQIVKKSQSPLKSGT